MFIKIKMRQFILIFMVTVAIFILPSMTVNSFEAESIIGGTETKKYEFKYQGIILADGLLKCGCGVLHKKILLAAAHCFVDLETGDFLSGNFTAIAPALSKDNWRLMSIYEIHKIYVPKFYKPNFVDPSNARYRTEGDIALVKLTKELDLLSDKGVSKLILPQNVVSYENETALLVGQGYSKIKVKKDPKTGVLREDGYTDGKLRSISATVVSNFVCDKTYSGSVHSSHLCARAIQKHAHIPVGSCKFDSGSPLVYENEIVIGVLISSPFGCDESRGPGIYTRVSAYYSMIQSILTHRSHNEMQTLKLKKSSDNTYKFVKV